LPGNNYSNVFYFCINQKYYLKSLQQNKTICRKRDLTQSAYPPQNAEKLLFYSIYIFNSCTSGSGIIMFEWQNRNRIYLLAVKWLDDNDGEGKFDPPRAEGAKDQSVTRRIPLFDPAICIHIN